MVLTGVSTRAEAEQADVKPDHIFEDLPSAPGRPQLPVDRGTLTLPSDVVGRDPAALAGRRLDVLPGAAARL